MKAKRLPGRVRAARDVDGFDEREYVPPHDYARRRARRRGWPWRKLFVLLAILIGIVAALPTIVAKTPLRNAMISYALPSGTLRVTVADAALGWFSPPALSGIEISDTAGQRLATVESIRLSRSPLALVSDLHNLGEVDITRPVAYVAVRPDGTNWQAALGPLLEKTRHEAVEDGPSTSSSLPAVVVRVVDGTLLVEETATGQRWRFHALNAQVDTQNGEIGLPPFSATGQIEAGVGANLAAAPASFSLALINDQGQQQLTWQLADVPLAAAEPWLRIAVPGAALRGGMSGQGVASWAATANPLSSLSTFGTLTFQAVDFAAPELAGDHLRLARIELPWRASTQPTGIRIDDLQLKCDVARLAVRGTLDPAILAASNDSAAAAVDAFARHDVEFQGEVDLAPVAAMLPRLLRIRSDTTITGGKLELAGRSQPAGVGQSLSGMLRASGLAATSAGRPLAWNEPIDATFDIRREAGNLRIESLRCNSEFLSIDAAGTAEQLTASAKFDLNRLAAQLGQFVDLTSGQLAGTGTAHIDWLQRGGDAFTLTANSELADLRVALADGNIYAEPRLALKAEANGSLDPATHQPRQVAAARLQIDAEGDQLDAQLTGAVDCTAQHPGWPLSVRLTGDIAQWLARVRPWFAIDPWQASGASDLAANLLFAGDAVDVSQAKLSLSNLRVVGVGWNIAEPRVELSGDLHWNGATGEVASQSSQLVSSAVSLAARDVRLQQGGNGPPRAGGVAAFRTDLARLAAWRAAPQPSPYRPQGMVTGSVRFDQQSDRITGEFTATGEQMALQQSPAAGGATQTIWQESQVNVRGTATYESAADRVAFRQFQVQSATLAAMADCQIDRLSTTADVNANGSLSYDLAQITPLLKPFIGDGIQLVGQETAKFTIAGPLSPGASAAGQSAIRNPQSAMAWARSLQARGELPWQSANIYGLPIGPGKLAAALGGGTVRVDPLSIAVAEGQLTTAPQVRLNPEPMELTLPPGPLLTNVRLSPEVSSAMLQYIAPVLAGATRCDGQFSLALSAARVPLTNPKQSDLSGQLAVHSVRVVPGPMAQQWVELGQQIEAIAKRRDLASAAQRQPVALLTIQDQQVNFRVVDGRVYHQGMQFQVGDVVMQTEGSVGFDQTVSILVRVPIQDKWIEGQQLLVGLKGQSLSIPVSGTLGNPRLDRSAVANLSQQLLQGAAQQAIGGELNKALDKLFKPR